MNLLTFIDFTYLKNDHAGFDNFLSSAGQLHVASICVFPESVAIAKTKTSHRIATVINFPEGNHEISRIKQDLLLSEGADELDIVFPYQDYLAGNTENAFGTIKKIISLCPSDKIIKVIVESGAFKSNYDIYKVCQFLITLPIHFLKTSTGKINVGATLEAADVMLSILKNTKLGFKASGGIRTKEQAMSYYELVERYFVEAVTPNNFRLGMSKAI